MSNSIRNRVQLLGHVGQDPELILLDSEKKLARFSLATNEVYYNSKKEKVERTHWHSLVFWDHLADTVEKYVKKGQKIAIEGKLTTHEWEDSAGMKHYRTQIVGKALLLL